MQKIFGNSHLLINQYTPDETGNTAGAKMRILRRNIMIPMAIHFFTL